MMEVDSVRVWVVILVRNGILINTGIFDEEEDAAKVVYHLEANGSASRGEQVYAWEM